MRKPVFCLLLLMVAAIARAQTPAPGTSEVLTWTEPTTTIPHGFKIYSIALSSTQTSCPTFSTSTWKLAQDAISSSTTTFTLSGVLTAGVTYCFAVTAYNNMGTGGESGPSNLIMQPDPSAGGGNTGTPPAPGQLIGTRK